MGSDHYDDSVVVRLNETTTLVQTVDFFTPIVDDPYSYGRIAAANSLSDVYAMGGTPVTAMNIVCFPTKKLGAAVLAEILRGGGDALKEAGVLLAGGHTVEDPEPKFGLAVTGIVDPDKVTFKGGVKPGDILYLTKPLGMGVLTTALKRDALSPELLKEAVYWMKQLNDRSCQAMVEAGCKAATDITGYGLLGHAMEMARASKLTLEIQAESVPLVEGVAELREAGYFPGGSAANRKWLEGVPGELAWGGGISETLRDLLCDAQTSGGLLVALPESQGEEFVRKLAARGRPSWRIGRALAGSPGILVV